MSYETMARILLSQSMYPITNGDITRQAASLEEKGWTETDIELVQIGRAVLSQDQHLFDQAEYVGSTLSGIPSF